MPYQIPPYRKPNYFCFTYSKVKNFEQCGRQHEAVDIAKLPGLEASGDAIDYGNLVHHTFKNVLEDNQPLPAKLKHLQYWVDYVNTLMQQPGAVKYIEEKWALDRDYNPTEYFGRPWMRYNCDVAVTAYDCKAGWLIDWKTGNRVEEPLQLWMGAAMMFQQFPTLEVVASMFVWLKEDGGTNSHECISCETIKRKDVPELWETMLPRIQIYEQAVDTGVFHPKPGPHCRYCRVQSCEHWGAKKTS